MLGPKNENHLVHRLHLLEWMETGESSGIYLSLLTGAGTKNSSKTSCLPYLTPANDQRGTGSLRDPHLRLHFLPFSFFHQLLRSDALQERTSAG